MAKLIYSTITSLDGYVADNDGNFDWAAPDEEVHTFVNDLERIGGHLPLRAPDVRGDALLGERTRRHRPATRRAGLRTYVAGGQQGRLLKDA